MARPNQLSKRISCDQTKNAASAPVSCRAPPQQAARNAFLAAVFEQRRHHVSQRRLSRAATRAETSRPFRRSVCQPAATTFTQEGKSSSALPSHTRFRFLACTFATERKDKQLLSEQTCWLDAHDTAGWKTSIFCTREELQ